MSEDKGGDCSAHERSEPAERTGLPVTREASTAPAKRTYRKRVDRDSTKYDLCNAVMAQYFSRFDYTVTLTEACRMQDAFYFAYHAGWDAAKGDK